MNIINLPACQTSYGTAIPYITKYSDGNLAVRMVLEDGEPLCTLSVNLPEHAHKLKPGEFFLKDWSENAALCYDFFGELLVYEDGEPGDYEICIKPTEDNRFVPVPGVGIAHILRIPDEYISQIDNLLPKTNMTA